VPPGGRPLGGRHVVTAVAAVTAGSFVVRLWFSARSGQIGDLHLWQWPACAGMFVFGVVTARHRWDRHIPDAVHRGCRTATLATLILLPPLALAAGVRDIATDAGPYLGGPHPQALATAAVEGVLVVAGSVWLVGLAERRLGAAGRRARAWTRGAFGAFVIQGPVLMALAAALRGFDAPAGVKAPLVAATAITACFWLGARLPLAAARIHGSHRAAAPPPTDSPRPT